MNIPNNHSNEQRAV